MATRVTEHRCQRVRCPDCGARQTGSLPAEVAASAFGPRLQAAIVTLSVRNRISRRDVVECCEQLFSARISTGSVEAILQRAGDALEQPYAHLLAAVRRARHVNMDETGWRLRGERRFLWGAFSARRFEPLEPRRLLVVDVVINEFVADNANGLLDQDGDHSDWIEIYNTTPQPINLSNCFAN